MSQRLRSTPWFRDPAEEEEARRKRRLRMVYDPPPGYPYVFDWPPFAVASLEEFASHLMRFPTDKLIQIEPEPEPWTSVAQLERNPYPQLRANVYATGGAPTEEMFLRACPFTRCATCGELADVLFKPKGAAEYIRGAWPIAVCPYGHVSWRRASDGTWHNSLPVSDSDD
jgi:hypothetical protein